MKRQFLAFSLTWLVVCTTGMAQEKPAAPPSPQLPAASANPRVQLKLQITVMKFQGTKKLSSHPFEVLVNANERENTRLRMLSDVPYPTGKLAAGETHAFRTVGTSIDCNAGTTPEGPFRLWVTVNDSSIAYPEGSGASPGGMSGVPRFRNFTAGNMLMLRDGETKQMMAATDPIDGLVMRVDVALAVVK